MSLIRSSAVCYPAISRVPILCKLSRHTTQLSKGAQYVTGYEIPKLDKITPRLMTLQLVHGSSLQLHNIICHFRKHLWC